MENTSRWDWNSNDADVCCITSTSDERYATKSFVIWGAGTQGRVPEPPLTKANHCANVVATANMSLPELLAAHFKPTNQGVTGVRNWCIANNTCRHFNRDNVLWNLPLVSSNFNRKRRRILVALTDDEMAQLSAVKNFMH
jgi:hypothetical protein